MSDPDDLLAQLGELEREYDDEFPHAWEDVVRGKRTAAEVIALREGVDDPEELAALAEVLVPLDAGTRDAWVERLAATLQTSATHASETESAPESAPAPESEPVTTAEPHATVIDLDARRRARITWMTAAGSLLAAAALVVWLSAPGDGPRPPGASALPSFSLTVRNETVHEIRSNPAAPGAIDRYTASSRIHWVVRPERSVEPPLGLRVLAVAEAGEPRRLIDPAGAVKVSARGVLELEGTLGELLPLSLGRWSLRMVVADPAALPADLAALDGGGPWTVSEPYEIELIP